jgi:hypothetical protein
LYCVATRLQLAHELDELLVLLELLLRELLPVVERPVEELDVCAAQMGYSEYSPRGTQMGYSEYSPRGTAVQRRAKPRSR